jgi:hypothetical protein
VQDAIAPASAAPPPAEEPAATPEPSAQETGDPGAAAGAATDVADACAYDPVQAEAALDQGQPETRNG